MKLIIGFALLAVGAISMCLGIRWLFFLGFGLMLFSRSLSIRTYAAVGWVRRLAGWIGQLGGVVVLLWLSSFGREPLPWAVACVAVFAVGMTEFDHWRLRHRLHSLRKTPEPDACT